MSEQRKRQYSTFGRPFRLRLSASSAAGFAGVASRGRCQFPACEWFEWAAGREYCREHWLQVYGQARLPDRDG